MERAFKQLYDYTSDSDEIRYGSIEFVNIASEDAKYMLVSCSAILNYLMEKWIKLSEKRSTLNEKCICKLFTSFGSE